MGYSHYLRGFTAPPTDEQWLEFCGNVRKVLQNSNCALAGWTGDFSEPVQIDSEAVCFNGAGENAFETFTLDRDGKDCCKTGRRPYDTMVVACLILAQNDLGLEVGSDGLHEDWHDGLELAQEALGRSLYIPNTIDG